MLDEPYTIEILLNKGGDITDKLVETEVVEDTCSAVLQGRDVTSRRHMTPFPSTTSVTPLRNRQG